MSNLKTCVEGCNLPSTPNDILLKQIKENIEKLMKDTEAKLLCHDGKIAELCLYIKENLEDSLKALILNMELNGELDEIISVGVNDYVNRFNDNFMLMTFFDESDSNKINFYVTKDGINLNKLNIPNVIYGRDPSIAYHNGIFYIAVTNYNEDHDFIIYTSRDLKTFETHYINVGLYDSASANKRVWSPNLFFENDKLIIHVGKEYEEGIFKIYKLESLNLNTLAFTKPVAVYLSNSSNYIDARVSKYKNTYYMVVKNENKDKLHLELYSSTDLKNWSYISNPTFKIEEYVEGGSLTEFNNNVYLVADRYAPANQSIVVSKSADLKTFTDFVEVTSNGSEQLRHGSVLACESYELKNIVSDLEGFNFSCTLYKEDITKPKIMMIGSELTNHLNKYVKLFTVKFTQRWKVCSVMFKLTDTQQNKFDNTYNLNLRLGDTNTLLSYEFNNITNSSNKLNDDLYCIRTGDNEWSVYLKATMTNITPCIQILSYTNFASKITLGTTKYIDSIDLTGAIKPGVSYDYLRAGIEIANIDLNNLKDPGVFYCYSSGQSSSIQHKPNGVTGGFRVENISTNGDVIIQKLYNHNDHIEIFYRYCSYDGTWFKWKKVVVESAE